MNKNVFAGVFAGVLAVGLLLGPSLSWMIPTADAQAPQGAVKPGESKTWDLKADEAGAWMYHCGADGLNGVWEHIANGMYGLVVVHPQNERPAKEFSVVFSEIYNSADQGPFKGAN